MSQLCGPPRSIRGQRNKGLYFHVLSGGTRYFSGYLYDKLSLWRILDFGCQLKISSREYEERVC